MLRRSVIAAVLILPTVALAQTQVLTSRKPKVAQLVVPAVLASEVTFTIPPNTTRIRFSVRSGTARYAWVAGETTLAAGDFMTVPQNGSVCQGNVLLSPRAKTDLVYFASPSAGGATVEIETWQ